MEELMKIENTTEAEWKNIIEQLEVFKKSEQHHRILETIIFYIKIIEEGRYGEDDTKFFEQLYLLLEGCKQLVEVVGEFYYSKELGAIVLKLVDALRKVTVLSGQKSVMHFIDDCLPYTVEAHIDYKTLCNHECGAVEDFFPSHLPNPYHLLNEIHTVCLRKAQSNLERYIETAIVTRVVDYWRTLFSIGNVRGDIQPLIELGEDLLGRIKECSDTKRKKVLWKMVLLLQMLLRDHPAVKALNAQDWPPEGFVQSLFPFECQSSFQCQQSINKLPFTLLKDYRQQLQASRVIFEDVIKGKTDVFKAQKNHTRQVIKMLEEMVLATRKLLGEPPCEIIVCILGSTSRYDRRPYSDFEYMILHSEVPGVKNKIVDFYICHFISIFELMIVSLGEILSEHNKNGFKIDQSLLGLTVSTKSKSWGTPEEVIKKYVIELNEPPHGWLDKGFFEYLNPIPLECPELGSKALFEQYLKDRDLYLNQVVSENDSPEAITQRFKIKEDWWRGLTRRQGIALASLCEMLHSVENAYFDVKARRQVNLKSLYYKPLLYSALSLGMYEGCQALTPSKTIQAYCATMLWGGEALLLWWQAALRYVVKEQAKQHLIEGCQHDSMMVSEDACWAGFDLIVEGFILPLHRSVEKCLSGALPIQTVAYGILKDYLNVRRIWLEKWEAKGLKRNDLLSHPLVEILSSYPDESGWSPQMELMLKHHHEGLLTLSTDRTTVCEFAGLLVEEKQPTRYLNEKIIQECFEEGRFVGDPELSSERSQVKKIIVDDKSWYIKVKEGNREGLMAREYLAMMVHLLLGGKPQVALGWPIQLRSEYQGKTKYHYAWVSEGIGGDSLGKVMLESPETLMPKNIDSESFSQLFLLSYLICPEDGQPENFKVINRDGKIQLVAIDYGQCFVQVNRVAGFFKNKEALVMKTMIYFLESKDEDLSSDFITRLRLLDIDRWFQSWIDSAKAINAVFNPLLVRDPATLSNSKRFAKPLCLIDVEDGLMLCVKKRLELLQYWLRTTDERITGRNLLRSCDRLVYLYYESLRGMIKTPQDFYEKLDKEAYEENAQGKIISSSSVKEIKKWTITAGALAQSCELEPSYFRRINFGNLSKADQQFAWELLEAVASIKGAQFFKLDLSGCEIDESKLIRLLEKMTNLQVLDLADCRGVDVMMVARLLAHRPGATIFTYNFKVLCPKLRTLAVTIESERCLLALDVGIEQRKLLTNKLRDFSDRFASVVQSLLRASTQYYDDKRLALSQLSQADGRVKELLLKALRDSEKSVRRSAAAAFCKLGKADDSVVEALLNALGDADSMVCVMAAVALMHLGIERSSVIEALLKSLSAPKEIVRKLAVQALGQREKAEERVIESLMEALEDSKWAVKHSAIEALGLLGKVDDRVIERLLKALSDSKELVRKGAVEAIGQIGKANDNVIEGLLKALSDSNKTVRELAVKALGQIGKAKDNVIEGLLKAFSDSRHDVKILARDALVKLGKVEDRVIEILLKALSVSNAITRIGVVEALACIGKCEDRVIGGVEKALEDSNWAVRRSAAEALGLLGKAEDRVIESVVKALGDSDREVRRRAAEALGLLGKAEDRVIERVVKALGDPDGEVRRRAAEALGRLGKAEARVIESLLVVAREDSNHYGTFRTVGVALGRLGYTDDYLIEGMLFKIQGKDAESAVELLVKLGRTENRVIDRLLKELQNSSVKCESRHAAVWLLGRIGKAEDRIMEGLLTALREFRAGTGNLVVDALGCIGKAEARVIEGFLEVLRDSDDLGTCLRVAEALVILGKSDDAMIEILLRVLRDPHICKYFALVLMGIRTDIDRMDIDRNLRLLLMALSDFEQPVLLSGMGESGGLRRAEDLVIEALLRGVADSERLIQIPGIRGLGRIGRTEDSVIEPLLKALNDHESVCISAAETLGKLGKSDDRVIEALLKIVKGASSMIVSVGVQALGLLLNQKNCWKRIQEEVRSFPFEKPELIEHSDFEVITKRIFFFIDDQTQRALPQVCRKWRNLYHEFKEEQALQSAPELSSLSVNNRQKHSFNVSFFGKTSSTHRHARDLDFLESFEVNKAALASQRAIIICEAEGGQARCRVVPAEPDGDCGFTGTSRVLDLLGRADIASQISRTQFIVLVREEFKKEHSPCKPFILKIFKADGIMSEDKNRALEQWCTVFARKCYWMQEAHFRFLSWSFNLEFCFYCVDDDKNILLPELGNESIYEGRDEETKVVVNLLHMTVTLREENTQLNHFDGLVINPTLEQEQRINLMLEEVTNALHLEDSSNGLEGLHLIKRF